MKKVEFDVEVSNYVQESEMLMQVTNHFNICRFYGLYKTERESYLLLELFPDGSLLGAMLNDMEFPMRQKIKFCYQLSCGLYHLKQSEVIHGDLALRNVLVDLTRNKCAITDFGLACRSPAKSPQRQLAPRWASPELLKTRIPTFGSDVWALGVTFWEILTSARKKPFACIPVDKLVQQLLEGCCDLEIDEDWPAAVRKVLSRIFVFEENRVDTEEVFKTLKLLEQSSHSMRL